MHAEAALPPLSRLTLQANSLLCGRCAGRSNPLLFLYAVKDMILRFGHRCRDGSGPFCGDRHSMFPGDRFTSPPDRISWTSLPASDYNRSLRRLDPAFTAAPLGCGLIGENNPQ